MDNSLKKAISTGAVLLALILAGGLFLSGCVLRPRGTKLEQERLQAAGARYSLPAEKRKLPELPQPAAWQDVLHRAFLANGDLEAAWFDWQAAMSRIEMAAAWPNSNVQVGFEYMFSRENMKAWDRTTISAGFDPSMTLSLPVKTRQAAKVALEEARVAGHRFEAAKFDLQKRVLTAYLDLALMEERIRIQRDNVNLLKLLWDTAAHRVQAGGAQQDLLKLRVEKQLAQNELANMEAQAQSMRALLNGMLARDPQAELILPAQLPPPRPVTADDAQLIAVAVERNPELAGLARQVAGRKEALELARLQYLPDIDPFAAFTGSVSQTVGAMVMLPTNVPAIRGQIQEARALLNASQAMARQVRSDRAGSFVAAHYAMRNAERQAQFFETTIRPASEQVLATTRTAYSTGGMGFLDLIESHRTLLEVKRMIAEARTEREKRLAEMEALAGLDIETLARTQPLPPATSK